LAAPTLSTTLFPFKSAHRSNLDFSKNRRFCSSSRRLVADHSKTLQSQIAHIWDY
jgi:hypothetical protein